MFYVHIKCIEYDAESSNAEMLVVTRNVKKQSTDIQMGQMLTETLKIV